MSVQESLFDGEEEQPDPVGQRLVAQYVDAYTSSTGHPPPRRIIGQMASGIGRLLHEGIPEGTIAIALGLCVRLGKGPNDLDYMVVKADARTPLADEYIAEHGWPTGVKMLRGSHGASYVPDVLGHDPPPAGVQRAVVNRQSIEAVLRMRGDG